MEMDWIDNISSESDYEAFHSSPKKKSVDDLRKTEFSKLDRMLMPLIAQVMTLKPGNDNHPYVSRLCKWLSKPQVNVDMFLYVVGRLHSRVFHLMHDYKYFKREQVIEEFCNIVGWHPDVDIPMLFEKYTEEGGAYVFRAAAEAMAIRDPVLEDRWVKVAYTLCRQLSGSYNKKFGFCSNRFSNWIIRVIGDSKLCPSTDLREQLILLYKTIVQIHNGNRAKALTSLMFVFSSLDRQHEMFSSFDTIQTQDVIDLLMLFTNDSYPNEINSQYLHKYGLNVANSLKGFRYMRQDYLLSNITENSCKTIMKNTKKPKELNALVALLKYVCEEARMEYKQFLNGIDNYYNIWNVRDASKALVFLVRSFKTALQDPLLLNVAVESIMDVMEATIYLCWDCLKKGKYRQLECLVNVNELLSI